MPRYRKLMLRFVTFGLCCVLVACGGGQRPAASPSAGPAAIAPPASEPASSSRPVATGPWGAPPDSCAESVAGKTAPGPCPPGSPHDALARALGKKGAASDAQLLALEACTAFPVGAIRALRAERLPARCRDLLTSNYAVPEGTRADLRDALLGLGISAQLRRLVQDPPTLPPPHDRARVEAFVKGELAKWIQSQAKAVFALSSRGASLSGYAKGIVAVEAGMADMRFVEAARSAPVPEEIRGDGELTEAYYATLDQALEPRKTRGRDAALVGLKHLAQVGVLRDERVVLARAMLSKLYAGRRIDALDALLLPTPKPKEGEQPASEAIAAAIPSFYVPLFVPKLDATTPSTLTALGRHGLPRIARMQLVEPAAPKETRALYARLLFDLARTYWRADDFRAAAKASAPLKGPAVELIAALSQVLQNGPKDAADMMLRGPLLPKGLTKVGPLDQLQKSSPSLSGFAAFDAAVLLETAPPPDAKAAYWKDVAARYAFAEKRLPPDLRKLAAERRKAAEETARAVR